MSVDLLPFLGTLQYPAVANHRTADALRPVAALRPVIQHVPVRGGVEDREGLRQRCVHANKTQI